MGLLDNYTHNPDNAEMGGDYSPIPDGEYTWVINAAEDHVSKTGNASTKFEFVIENGEYEGRKYFKYLSSKPENLAKSHAQLDALLLLVGPKGFNNTLDWFVGKTFKQHITVKKNAEGKLENQMWLSVKKGNAPEAAAPAKPSTRPVAAPAASW